MIENSTDVKWGATFTVSNLEVTEISQNKSNNNDLAKTRFSAPQIPYDYLSRDVYYFSIED